MHTQAADRLMAPSPPNTERVEIPRVSLQCLLQKD